MPIMSSYRVRWTNSIFVYQSSFTSIVSDSQVLIKLLSPARYSSACSVAVWSSMAVVSWPWTFSFLPPLPAAKYLFTTGQSNKERAVGRSFGRSYNKQHHVSVTDALTWFFTDRFNCSEKGLQDYNAVYKSATLSLQATLDPILYANRAWGPQYPTVYKPMLWDWAYSWSSSS